jgi:hypothetical protein
MLNAAKGRRWREGPLAEINNKEEFEAWLRKQPREVAVAFAARAALRVLPILQTAQRRGVRGDFFASIVLPASLAAALAAALSGKSALAALAAAACGKPSRRPRKGRGT